MENQDQIVDKDAEQESGEYSQQVADETFHAEPALIPEEKAPELTAEQIKALHVAQSAKLVRGNSGRPGSSKIGVTRPNKKLSKKAEKKAKESRRRNRK